MTRKTKRNCLSYSRYRRPSVLSLAACLPVLASGQEAAVTDIEELRVVGHPLATSPEELAQPVTVVSAETLDRVRATNIGETLAGQLGVNSSYFGAGSSRPIIRGLAGARVRTMEDGIDSMDVSTVSVDHAVGIDPLVAQQIEIFRGPTTLLYGSGAVGGVVNTVTNRIPEIAPDDGFEGAFELRGDSAAEARSGAIAIDGGNDALAWHVDALRRDTKDYEIPGFAVLEEDEREPDAVPGTLENSDIEVESFAVGGSWLGENGFLGVSVSSFDTNYGIPGHHHHEEGGVPGIPAGEEEGELARIDLEQTRVDLKGGWFGLSGGIDAINLRLGFNDYEHVELEGTEIGTRFENDAFEGRVELVHSPWGAWSGAVGLQFSDRQFSAVGEEAFVPPVDTSSYGIFLIEQLQTENWQFSAGGRFEWQEHTPSGSFPTTNDTAASLSLAAIRQLGNGYSLAMNFALAERLPVAEELYSDGPHLATGLIEVGDPNIGTETSQHLDIGVRKMEGDLRWAVTAFVTSYEDFIFLRDSGLTDPDEALPIFNFAQQDADFIGVEAEVFTPIASVGPQGELDLRVFADYVRGELDTDEYLPRMPPLRYGARLQYHDDRFIVGVETTHYDDQDKLAPFEESTQGYTMVNADFNWRMTTRRGPELDVFIIGTNLLDEDARKHTSFVKETTPLPGRNYSAGVRARF